VDAIFMICGYEILPTGKLSRRTTLEPEQIVVEPVGVMAENCGTVTLVVACALQPFEPVTVSV
jgi:hypothetical protein